MATSTSNPVYDDPSWNPRPGWSNLMPILTVSPPPSPLPPADCSGSVVVLSSPTSPLLHAASVSAVRAASTAAPACRVRIVPTLREWWSSDDGVPRRSVGCGGPGGPVRGGRCVVRAGDLSA
ncbi:Uncharacterised protein [Mycobacteroides abscessus]|nr:Uncharacterised protein [Mycobacteroides abscessus]